MTKQEGFAYLLELFNKTKVNLLSDKINDHFNIVKWQLFKPMVNGGEEECCEPMVNGKPYTTALNSGHKILAELDIINALQKIYDCQVPVFLDNEAEPYQIIVTFNDKQRRISGRNRKQSY